MTAPPTLASQDAAMLLVGSLVASLTGISADLVLFANTDLPQPSANHITMQALSDTAAGHPSRVGDRAEQPREMDVLVTAHGSSAVTGLRALCSTIWMDTPTRLASIDAGLSLRSVSAHTDVSAIDSSSVQPRTAVTIRFGYVLDLAAAEPTAATEVSVTVDGGPAIITPI